jgi:hypothetical protein
VTHAEPTRWQRARDAVGETVHVGFLAWSHRELPASPGPPNAIVSLTSYPARIQHAWIPIEQMLRHASVDRVVLVLGDDEFGTRDLPRRLVAQQRRGLEIMWIPRSADSYNKLVPTVLAYPDAIIVTIDDDARYAPWTVPELLDSAREHPGTIVGHRGWEVASRDGELLPYNRWARATLSTPPERVFLTGVGGVLYPPGALPTDLVTDLGLARRLCPTSDDVWFWAVARAAGVPVHCLDAPSHRGLFRQRRTPKLEDVNRGERRNDAQIAAVVAHFGLAAPTTGPH